jgi:competence ComEA-like helix-hairpin-helix protein
MSDEENTEMPEADADGAGEGLGANPFEMVQEIERILADDPEDREVSEDSVEFPLPDALELIPHRYLKEVDPEDVYGETVLVTPDNLFQQLAAGKVVVPLSKLAYYIPLHLIYHAALNEETMVELPLKKVVKAVGLEELRRRTPGDFRLYDISVFDDPFKEGDASSFGDNGLVMDDEDSGGGLVFDDEHPEDSADSAEEIPDEAAEPEAVVATEPEAAEPAPEEPEPEEPVVPSEEPEAAEQSEETVPVEPAEAHEEVVEEKAAVAASEDKAEELPAPLTGDTSTVSYSLDALLRALPEGVASKEPAEDTSVELSVPDVLSQLKRGAVTMQLSDVVGALPESAIQDGAAPEGDGVVKLDLKQTVEGVGLDTLVAQTASDVRTYDIDWMADPFEEPDEKPDLEAVRSSKKEKKREKAEAAPPPEEAPAASQKVTVYQPRAETDSELEYYELPGNVNINAATSDELMLLKGVGRHIADAIVAYGNEHGGFNSVFDLFKVEGIDEVRFRQMTGMKSGQKRRHRRKRLASMLKIPAAEVADPSAVAAAVSRKAGFEGCIISDSDGLVIAQSGLDGVADNFAAILPGMLGHIAHGMDVAGLEVTGTVSVAVEGSLYTVQSAENVIFSACHAANMVSEADLSFMRKVGRELAWLLSIRAYAGPKP